MKFGLASLAIIAAATVEAANHQVMVGLTGLTYSPNSVTAPAGDTIEFIVSGTHDIVEAAFGSPCSYMTGGAWSGLSPQPNFVITVTSTSPRFFYCSVATHCQSGMVFALNPSNTETEAAFASAAAGTSNSVMPSGPPVGGTSGPVPSGAGSSSSAAATTGSATSAAASSSGSSSINPELTEIYSSSTTASGATGASGATTGTKAPSGSGTGAVASSEGGKLEVKKWLSVVSGIMLAMVVARA